MRAILRELLRAFGFHQVSEAESAAQAMVSLCEASYDLLILDYNLPEKNGAQLALELRLNERSPCPFIPIIMVTGHATRDLLLRARDSGVDEILAKPLTAQALQERLASVLHHRREFVRTKTFFGPDRRRFRGLKIEPERLKRATDPTAAPIPTV